MPTFDWTISLGTVLHLAGSIALFTGLYWGLVAKITKLESDHQHGSQILHMTIEEIKSDVKEIRKDLIERLDERVRHLEIKVAAQEGKT